MKIMQFLKQLAQVIRKHPFLTLGVVLCCFVLIGMILVLLTPNQKKTAVQIQTPTFFTKNAIQVQQVTISPSSSISTSPVPVLQVNQYQPQAFLPSTTQAFQFEQNTKVQNAYQSSDGSIIISPLGNDGTIQYVNTNNSLSDTNASNGVITKETAVTHIQQFLQKIGYPQSEINLDSPQVIYYQNGDEDAGVSEIPTSQGMFIYTLSFNGTGVGIGNAVPSQLQFIISTKGIVKAIIPPYISVTQTNQVITPFTADQIKQNIQKGLISVTDATQQRLSSSEISTLSIDTMEIEYRFDVDQNLLIPFIHITATATVDGNSVPVNAITPAINFSK
ncbi:hypothetical protein C5B42_01775 [Candidatus Cerribacteria bacterium 'Amazon FNV 2010 28 9']|uniref:Uncharacterized protein n=1 Tax=Candidatus Cerribacteria bacterium 'Amazon FNV 2010 28 9' TaxID=2081795 RepID=A0A317JQB3_9BACT|nr:MAG: hypothetical protein C5B42_01775 [Candidatus Cerribacteria bacterium 'Amazon FNV 2010 28 9']